MSFSSLPVINFQSNIDEIGQCMLSACTTTGFFYLSNHGLDEYQKRMFTLAKDFFHLPLDEKLSDSVNNTYYHGYLRIGSENLDSTNSQMIDQKEAFKMGQSDLIKKENFTKTFLVSRKFSTD